VDTKPSPDPDTKVDDMEFLKLADPRPALSARLESTGKIA